MKRRKKKQHCEKCESRWPRYLTREEMDEQMKEFENYSFLDPKPTIFSKILDAVRSAWA